MEHESVEPQAPAPSPWALPSTRHDGWTGDKMAKFCETLADSGVVLDACLAVGMSAAGAYATRRRNPLFAAAWEAALVIARERLADTLLARSIEGTTEQYFKDGELVGEKKVIDNRLGLAILKRLDRMAEGLPLNYAQSASPSPATDPKPVDWDLALAALQSGEPDVVAEALAMLTGPEVDEVDTPPFDPPSEPGPHGRTREDARVWQDEDGQYWTDFPPPPDFNGESEGEWGYVGYSRHCSASELEAIDTNAELEMLDHLVDDERERRAFFKLPTSLEES